MTILKMYYKKNDIKELFNAIDNFDVDEFINYLTDDALFRFANIPQVKGKKNIYEFVDNFFKSIKSIKSIEHTDLEIWQLPDILFVNGKVTYTRKDDTKLSVYFSNTFKMKVDKIYEYLIFGDNSVLFS